MGNGVGDGIVTPVPPAISDQTVSFPFVSLAFTSPYICVPPTHPKEDVWLLNAVQLVSQPVAGGEYVLDVETTDV